MEVSTNKSDPNSHFRYGPCREKTCLRLGAGADLGFLERVFRYIKMWGIALLIFSFFLNIPMKMKLISFSSDI